MESPPLQVTGNSRTISDLSDDIGFDAGGVLSGGLTLAEAGTKLARLIARIAAGESGKPEALSHHEYFITANTRTPRHLPQNVEPF